MSRGRAANGSGMQPRQRKDGLWEVRYCAGTDPGTGKPIRKSHENPDIQKLYKEFLGEPLSEKSHHLLHTHYFDKSIK